jgi:hypothetical protein
MWKSIPGPSQSYTGTNLLTTGPDPDLFRWKSAWTPSQYYAGKNLDPWYFACGDDAQATGNTVTITTGAIDSTKFNLYVPKSVTTEPISTLWQSAFVQ